MKLLRLLLVLVCLASMAGLALAQEPPPPGEATGVLPGGAPGASQETLVPERSTSETATTSNSGPAMAFFLVVVLCLFGYHLFSSYSLNARIDRLEEMVRRGGARGRPERDDLVPFSWDTVLRSLESGLPFLGEATLPRPGLVLVGARPADLVPTLLANVARTILQDPDLVAVAVTRTMGQEELGRRLLSMEAGRDWSGMERAEREEVVRRLGKDLERMERSLYCMADLVLTPRQLFDTCQELLQEGELGGVLLDGLHVLAPDEEDGADLLDRLRMVSLRCHVPVFLVVPVGSPEWQAGAERFLAVVEVAAEGGSLRSTFHRFPGPPPALSLALEPGSGRLVPASSPALAEHP